MQCLSANNTGLTPANLTGNNGDNSGKVIIAMFALASVGLWGGLRIESAFSIVMFSAPLCGVKRVRVEVQNVGNILLR
jgi:hypothetical protein